MRIESRRFPAIFVALLLLMLPESVVSIQNPLLSVDLPTLWRSVDAVVYLRIQETSGVRMRPTNGKSEAVGIEHKASVLEVFRRYWGTPNTATLSFLQLPDNAWNMEAAETAHEATYRPGEQLVAFLRWNASEQVFQEYLVVPIRDGQVKSPHIDEIASGMKLESFLIKLRAMME